MKKNNYPGKFIAFEGIDGSGKTTQSKILVEKLNRLGKPSIWTKNPYKNLDLGARRDLKPMERQELFVRDRLENLEEVVIPNLKEGENVVIDRYCFSTIAYGTSEEINREFLLDMHEKIIGDNFIIPDIVFIIDVPADIAMARLEKKDGDRKYYETKDKLEKVRNAHSDIYKDEFYKEKGFIIKMIDSTKSIEDVAKDILEEVMKIF